MTIQLCIIGWLTIGVLSVIGMIYLDREIKDENEIEISTEELLWIIAFVLLGPIMTVFLIIFFVKEHKDKVLFTIERRKK